MKTTDLPDDLRKLVREFRSQLGAKVNVEQVSPGRRFRFALTSPKFQRMPHLRRQDHIWKVVDSVLDRDKSLRITMILAYAPHEVGARTERVRRRKAAA